MSPPPVQSVTLPPGTRLGPYRVEVFVAAGGMGEVYRARDERLGRTVAIKVLPAAANANPERLRRFEQEARAASALNHPHICVLHDIGCEQPDVPGEPGRDRFRTLHFLVLEYLNGVSLAHQLLRGPLSLPEVLEIGAEIGDALAQAHRAGIIHRDLKPGNVFLTAAGAKLLDFGLAKLGASDQLPPAFGPDTTADWTTRTGAVQGTLPYMAPELLEGRDASARSDIFAFGCLLYEMATGQRAFPGDSDAAVMAAIRAADPPPMRRLQPRVPRLLDRLVRTCLARDPDKRWDSAHDVAEQLRGYHESLQAEAVDIQPPPPPRPWRGWRAVAAAGILVALAAVAVPLIGPYRGGPAVVPRNLTASRTWDAEPALSPQGTFVAFTSGESGNADVWLVPVQGGAPAQQLTDHPAWDLSPAWFPDGSQIAFVSEREGRRSIWRTSPGGSPLLLVPDAEDPAVSPDGRRIAFTRLVPAGNRRLFVAPLSDVTAARMITTDADGLFDHRDPAWSPADGETIVYRAQRDLWLVPASGGGARRLTTDNEVDLDPCWSSDGREVVFSSMREGTYALWRVLATGSRPPTRVTPGSAPESHPSTSADGRRLVYSTAVVNLDIVLRDVQTGRSVRHGSARSDLHPALSHDGRTLYFISDRLGKYDLWAQALSGIDPVGAAHRFTDERGSVSMPDPSPDGRWVAYGRAVDSNRDVWVVSSVGGPATRITDGSAVSGQPVWSPDSSRLAFVSNRNGVFRVWCTKIANGAAEGRPWLVSAGPGSDHLRPTWSPDGTRLAYVSTVQGIAGDVWTIDAAGEGPAVRVTTDAEAVDARWPARLGRLVVNGFWGGASPRLRSLLPGGGDPVDVEDAAGRSADAYLFDVSPDGRILVLSAEERRGNISVLEAATRVY